MTYVTFICGVLRNRLRTVILLNFDIFQGRVHVRHDDLFQETLLQLQQTMWWPNEVIEDCASMERYLDRRETHHTAIIVTSHQPQGVSNHRHLDPWASCQIRKIAGAHAPGMPGTFSPSPRVSDPDMHHGTCVTHVPWCMPGSLTSGFLWNRRRGKTFPAFPAHAQPAILRIW